MPDIISIQAGLAAVTAATDIIKRISNFSEVKEEVVDLREKLLDIREALNDSKEENLNLREKIKELEIKIDQKSKLEYHSNDQVYYLKKNEKLNYDKAFCPKCYGDEEKLMTMKFRKGNTGKLFSCLKCKSNIQFHDFEDTEILF